MIPTLCRLLTKPSYIDDVALYVTGKTAKENSEILQEVTKTVFAWAEVNAVQFDDSKSELIHFCKSRKEPTAEITLPNNTVIKPASQVKWLGIWLDRKLTFKAHVQKKVTAATRVLHLIHRLMNSEWGLSAQAEKQLYLTCITSVSDYGAEIWWKGQKSYQDQLQKLQNKALHKILGAFKTSPTAAMELKASIEPVKVRLNKKCRKYALRVITLPDTHPIRQRTPLSFPPENGSGQEISLESNFLDWNQNSCSQKHPTQLVRVLNSISTLIPTAAQISIQSENPAPWEESIPEVAKVNITEEDNREKIVKEHFTHIRRLIEQEIPIFYTDGSKLKLTKQSEKFNLGAGIYYIHGQNTITESYFLGHTQDTIDAEMYAISQAIKWIEESALKVQHYWIFTDSQVAIQRMQRSNAEMHEILQDLKSIKLKKKTVHISWISSHTQIPENELADQAAKEGARNASTEVINASNKQLSLSYIKKDIEIRAKEEWTELWKKAKHGQQYSKLQQEPMSKTKFKELKQAKRLVFSTFTQIKLGHGYFKSYLERLPAYDTNLCNVCKVKQTPEHMLLNCKIYKAEQKTLKNAVLQSKSKPGTGSNSELSLRRLLCTGEEIRNTLAFLDQTKIATRKWILGEIEEEEELEWESVDREV